MKTAEVDLRAVSLSDDEGSSINSLSMWRTFTINFIEGNAFRYSED